jgi:chromatin remodeling complex protein RSC6
MLLPHILALKMSSSVTVDQADIATLSKALAVALDRKEAADKAAGFSHQNRWDDLFSLPEKFTTPERLSPQLCSFLGIPHGTMLSPREVTLAISNYAEKNNLFDKQVIRADAALRTLLALKPDDELKFLNLQRFVKPHYLRA